MSPLSLISIEIIISVTRRQKKGDGEEEAACSERRVNNHRGFRAKWYWGVHSPAPKLWEIGSISNPAAPWRPPISRCTIECLVSGRVNIRAAPWSHCSETRIRIIHRENARRWNFRDGSHRRDAARRARDFCLCTIARRDEGNETKSLAERSLGS